ncbi:hypothetical protein BAAA27672_05925 [Bifidobacterium animalis subsp. animalis ATCC 27672]|nr:hypothetical protein BAAA27672_05925 [Bifidobacterium animalis subsp. animalis ATCC 27672]
MFLMRIQSKIKMDYMIFILKLSLLRMLILLVQSMVDR